MNDLSPCRDRAAGQVVFVGCPVSAAGQAAIEPVPGLVLTFDRMDGRLCWAVAETAAEQPDAFDQQVAAMLTRLFGPNAPDVALGSVADPGNARAMRPEPGLAAALSSLARLEAVQAASPVPRTSPWWAAEAAGLAERAGLAEWASDRAGRALPGLLRQRDRDDRSVLPRQAINAARRVAELCSTTQPRAAERLLAVIDARSGRGPMAGPGLAPAGAGLDVAEELDLIQEREFRTGESHWLLDPDWVPPGLFRFGLSPASDLFVQTEGEHDQVVVVAVATLAPQADRGGVSHCAARMVDPSTRRIIARGGFAVAGSRALAELKLTMLPEERAEAWIEVVADKRRPIMSRRGYWSSYARRWAEAALRAERAPRGIDPRAAAEEWSRLAVAAWDRCGRGWAAVGDLNRADVAAGRRTACQARLRSLRSASVTADRAAVLEPTDGPCYLAELIGY